MKKCNVENCENKHLAKGYCQKHYAKFRKYGDPLHTKLHGMSNSSEYKIWRGIIDRCCNMKLHYFKKYGGRGITVCDEWKNSFLAFYRDMGSRPSKNHSIDRIDNEKGYLKENCRWADRTTQARNKRIQKNNKSGFPGVNWDKSRKKWMVTISIKNKTKSIGRFKTIEKAIEERKKAELKYWKLCRKY